MQWYECVSGGEEEKEIKFNITTGSIRCYLETLKKRTKDAINYQLT